MFLVVRVEDRANTVNYTTDAAVKLTNLLLTLVEFGAEVPQLHENNLQVVILNRSIGEFFTGTILVFEAVACLAQVARLAVDEAGLVIGVIAF